MRLLVLAGLGLATAFAPREMRAQDSAALRKAAIRDTGSIPVKYRPPVGMCRVWLDDVPMAQQPAPTDCASAVRNRPPKGRVVFGDDYVKSNQSLKVRPPLQGFAQTKTPAKTAKKPAPKDTLR